MHAVLCPIDESKFEGTGQGSESTDLWRPKQPDSLGSQLLLLSNNLARFQPTTNWAVNQTTIGQIDFNTTTPSRNDSPCRIHAKLISNRPWKPWPYVKMLDKLPQARGLIHYCPSKICVIVSERNALPMVANSPCEMQPQWCLFFDEFSCPAAWWIVSLIAKYMQSNCKNVIFLRATNSVLIM